MFINSLIFNSEAWYNVTNSDFDELEKADEALLRKILECPAGTPKEMLYLELGCLPIRFIIMGRRIMFLQYILKQDSDSLINAFFQAQLKDPNNKDWCQVANENLESLGIKMTLSQIKLMTEEKLKEIVKKACEEKALVYLNKKKEGHSKVMHLSHTTWEIQPYLKPNHISIDEAKFIFLARSRMLDVRNNFRNKYSDTSCPNCNSALDDQEHLLACTKLVDGVELVDGIVNYENIFLSKLEDVLQVSRILKANFKKRKDIIKSSEVVTHVNRS